MKKFLLLSLMAIGLLAAPKAAAYTAEELDGKHAWVKVLDSPNDYRGSQTVPRKMNGNIVIKAVGPNQIELSDFIDTSVFPELDGMTINVYATVSGNTFTIDGGALGFVEFPYLVDYANPWYGYNDSCYLLSRLKLYENRSWAFFLFPTSAPDYEWYGEKVTGTISEKDGVITFKTCPFDVVKLSICNGKYDVAPWGSNNWRTTNGTYYDENSYFDFTGVEYETYTPNAIVTDTRNYIRNNNLNSYSKSEDRTYSAEVGVNLDKNQITFVNFGNLGRPHGYPNSTTDFTVTGIGYTLASLNYNTSYPGWTIGQATYSAYYNRSFFKQYAYAGDYNSYQRIPVTLSEQNRLESYGTNQWHDLKENGVRRYTYKLTIGDYVTDFEGSSYSYDSKYTNTTIEVYEDYTHTVALENVKFGYGHINNDVDNYLYVEGDIVPGENADHVESYELYMIPGAYSSVSGSAFNNADKGHTQGFCLEGFDYNGWNNVNPTSVTVDDNADESGVIHFQRVVPENTLKENSAFNNNNSYSFYVKTNYSAESGLESTFHALTPFNNTTTGVEDIIDNGELNDEDAPVLFYNMNGVLMDGNNLTPGLYIRRQGSSTSKVIIR